MDTAQLAPAPAARETFVAYQHALAAFERARTTAETATGLGRLAELQRRGAGLARGVEARVAECGRPPLLAGALDEVSEDARRIARNLELVAGALDETRRRALAGSWLSPEVSRAARAEARLGAAHLGQLGAILDRLRVVSKQAMRHLDAAFARIEADPTWDEKLREALDLDD
jgi:hypothetical protein